LDGDGEAQGSPQTRRPGSGGEKDELGGKFCLGAEGALDAPGAHLEADDGGVFSHHRTHLNQAVFEQAQVFCRVEGGIGGVVYAAYNPVTGGRFAGEEGFAVQRLGGDAIFAQDFGFVGGDLQSGGGIVKKKQPALLVTARKGFAADDLLKVLGTLQAQGFEGRDGVLDVFWGAGKHKTQEPSQINGRKAYF
jgi:hypothetical protein